MSGMRPCHVVSSEHGVFCERGIYIRVGRLTLTYMIVMNDRLCVFQELKYKAIESYNSLPLASWVESSRVSYGAHGPAYGERDDGGIATKHPALATLWLCRSL